MRRHRGSKPSISSTSGKESWAKSPPHAGKTELSAVDKVETRRSRAADMLNAAPLSSEDERKAATLKLKEIYAPEIAAVGHQQDNAFKTGRLNQDYATFLAELGETFAALEAHRAAAAALRVAVKATLATQELICLIAAYRAIAVAAAKLDQQEETRLALGTGAAVAEAAGKLWPEVQLFNDEAKTMRLLQVSLGGGYPVFLGRPGEVWPFG
jgi:hypothetical protein